MKDLKTNDVDTVLIIDDEPDLCEMLEFEFSARGYRTFSALDGKKAFNILEEEEVSAVISDVRMPFLDGIRLLERSKSSNVFHPIIILMSAYADLSLAQAYNLGAEAFFPKPFHLADMAGNVQQLLLPAEQRWQYDSDTEIPLLVERSFASIQPEPPSPGFALGRGGFAINNMPCHLLPGERVAFQINFEAGPITSLEGYGLLRWVEAKDYAQDAFVLGIEFCYLNQACRQNFRQWREEEQPKAYIPKLPQDEAL